jgi:hypothetical protein
MNENDKNPEDVQDEKDIEEGADDAGADDEGNDDEGEEGKDNKPDSKDKPSKESPEDKVARLKRQLAREERKLGKGKTDEQPKPQTKPGEFGLVEKTYLKSEGIKGADEIKLVKEFMKNTGKSLDSVVESKYFQAELKELRESRAATDATPKGKNRSGQSSRDTVEYWVAKGELPPADQVELRRQVVNAKMAAQKTGNVFSSRPVIGG